MDKLGINNVLEQLRTASVLASGGKTLASAADAENSVDFSRALKGAIDQVNHVQQTAGKLSRSFASDESETNLHEVMISLQKAEVSFQSMVQTRNKLVAAYQTIMNMQV
ncbi:flagellar hook-basal body complex protein FliE [Nitrosomonas cryotolerans]|uniref:Flagellar hook-basal body complex protein FliE n=1 Tax=Nitrosomonas cryotolerans ATCC 49181 TaxID=1131553 RepID=A0A1N6I5Y7_9PROT|nr:flagellar hook-basal body complex protein FliE [Nitrosomonas cryotolerans]SFP91408.1 flagellar hook-basal body complex protein FliE [Nitrosomonas cryotolerans]SIO27456.1 flagellar hook-basal body complex protein FliE [Nitrosomonas cryotolerans ATCC 49181]